MAVCGHERPYRDFPRSGRLVSSQIPSNIFAYVGGNPLSGVDPKGLQAYPQNYDPRNPGFYSKLNPNNKMSTLQPETKCVLACQAKMYPACAATAYGVGVSFTAVATPVVGLGVGIVTSATCNAVVMRSYCTQQCEKTPDSCQVELPPIDPNAQSGQSTDYTY